MIRKPTEKRVKIMEEVDVEVQENDSVFSDTGIERIESSPVGDNDIGEIQRGAGGHEKDGSAGGS